MDLPLSKQLSGSKLPKLVQQKNTKESPLVTITPPSDNINFQRTSSIPSTQEAELKELLSNLNFKPPKPKLQHENSKSNLTLPSLCLKPLSQMPPIPSSNPLTKTSSESCSDLLGLRKPKFALPTVALATQIAISMKNSSSKEKKNTQTNADIYLSANSLQSLSSSPPDVSSPTSPNILSATGSIESASARSLPSSSASSSPRTSRSADTPPMNFSTAVRPRSFSLTASPPPKTTESISENHDSDGNLHINQYQIMTSIGQGMYGKVKLAIDTETGLSYAVKILRKTRLKRMRRLRPGKISDAFQEVLVEIAIMKKLNHPNVIKLYEVLDDPQNDKLFMVLEYAEKGQAMELANGETTSQTIPEDVAWKYFRDLIAGLDYLHVQNIVHRDVKPENLLIASDGTLKIGDFGVSQVMDNSKQNITGSQGSPAFLAPEMSSRKSFKPKPLDVWAAGVTLYCFIFGKVPFTGKNYLELVAHIQNEDLQFNHHIEAGLQDLLTKILEKDPETRITISQIKVSELEQDCDIQEHPWVTKHGEFPMDQVLSEVWVTEEEIQSAIKPIDTFTGMVKLKSIARKLHRNLHSASSQLSNSSTTSGQSTPSETRAVTPYSVTLSPSSSSSLSQEDLFTRVMCSGNLWKITSPAPFQD